MTPDIKTFYSSRADYALTHIGASPEAQDAMKQELRQAYEGQDYAKLAEIAERLDTFPKELIDTLSNIGEQFNAILKEFGVEDENIDFQTLLSEEVSDNQIHQLNPISQRATEIEQAKKEERARKYVPHYASVVIMELTSKDSTGSFVHKGLPTIANKILTEDYQNPDTIKQTIYDGIIHNSVRNFYQELVKTSLEIGKNDIHSIAEAKAKNPRLRPETREMYEYIAENYPKIGLKQFKSSILYRFIKQYNKKENK